MTRAGFAVAAIVLSATVALALPEPAIWDHNGSVMYLVANKPEVPSRNGDELPTTPAAQASVKNGTLVAAKDSAVGVADANVPSAPTAQASVTNEIPGAKDLDKDKWGAAIIVMIAWLSIVSFGKILIRRKG